MDFLNEHSREIVELVVALVLYLLKSPLQRNGDAGK